MDATVGREADAVAFLGALAEAPHRYDFYDALRRLECLYADKPRWGRAVRPVDEPLRLGQAPDLAFAPSPLAALNTAPGARAPRLQVRLFGLLGPNGPLPLHITEYVRERARHAGDQTLSAFLDVLQHRFIAFFYRAWAQAQPHVNHDRPSEDRFTAYLGAFMGISAAPFRARDELPDLAKFFHVGTFIRPTRNADGLAAVLRDFFRVPVEVEQWVGHWLVLSAAERTRLEPGVSPLGAGAVLGSRVYDRQHKFRLHLGPLTYAQYQQYLPGGRLLRQLVDWVRLYVGFEMAWDVCLQLRQADVPRLRLGNGTRLGWTTWLGERHERGDADDLRLNAERFVRHPGVRIQ